MKVVSRARRATWLAVWSVFCLSQHAVARAQQDAPSSGVVETAAKGQTAHVRAVVPPAGCMANDRTDINAPAALYRHFKDSEGNFYPGGTGVSALLSKDWILVAEASLSDGRIVGQLLEQLPTLLPQSVRQRVVFESPTELFFENVKSGSGVASVITSSPSFPGFQKSIWTEARYTLADGRVVFALSRQEGLSSPPRDLLAYDRVFAMLGTARSAEGQSTLYFVGKPMRAGPQVVHAIERLKRAHPDSLVLHPGNFFDGKQVYDALCVAPLARITPAAVSVNVEELAMGSTALAAFAKKYRVPFVAANLRTQDGKAAFPAHRLVRVGDTRVAIVGLVDPTLLTRNQSGRITPSVRSQWKIAGPIDTLARVIRDLREQDAADVVVVLAGSARGELTQQLRTAKDVDVVVAGHAWQGAYERRFQTEAASSRLHMPSPRPLAVVVRNEIGVTELDLVLQDGNPVELVHVDRPILYDAPRDENLFAQRREREEKSVNRLSGIVLPSAEKVLAKKPELEALVWGEKVLHRNHFDEVTRDEPARWSDPLWMRLVTNTIREREGVDVVLMRNMDRGSQTVGDLPWMFTAEWLDTPEPLVALELSGTELKRVQGYLARQNEGKVSPDAHVFAAGMDTKLISGRPLDESRTYRALVGERVLDLASFEAWSTSVPAVLTVSAAVGSQLDAWSGPSHAFDPVYVDDVAEMLVSHADRVIPRWELRLDSLSLRVSQFSNTGDTTKYAASRETRVTTPNNFSLAAGAELALLYDDALIAWETRAKAAYQRVKLATVEQEPVDDLLAFTELRFNSVSLPLGDSAWPLVPFARVEYDTEFTAVDDPAGGTLAHQHLLREQAGFSLTSPTILREFRLFALAQQDLGSGPVVDFGLGAALKLRAEVSVVVITSESQVRYFFDDGDDRDIDLGLVMQSDNRITTPLTEWLSVYAFADLFFVRGKTQDFKSVAGSTIVGVGFDARAILQL